MSYMTGTYIDSNKILRRMKEHLEYARSVYGNDWVAITAHGSMNYELMDENSDVDTKLFLIPSLNDIVLQEKPISKALIIEDGTK